MKKKTDKPQLHLVCNAHLDPYWQWEWEEGAAAAVSTFRTAADCCDLSESFIFCHNEVILYQWIESFEPELFRRIRRLVKAGRWHIMGGWYLQPDCNMPCGESFVRQMLIGKRWFLEKFGVEPRTAINFDSFGHTRGLVQILRKGGYDSYIALRLGDNPQPPPEFIWVGYDGSEIIVKRDECWYSTPLGQAAEKVREVKEQFRRGRPVTLRLWGVGNHGGGPSRKDVEDLDAYIAATTDCAIKHSTPEAFIDALRASGMPLPRVERDLNPCMVGCYTSQVRIKQKHRLLENELYATETMLATAAMQNRLRYPGDDLRAVMQDLATAQFHDILPGSSVQNVEEAALRLLDHGLEILSRQKARAFFALAAGQPPAADGEIPILIYNPHPWPVTGVWECEFGLADFSFKQEFTLAKAFQDGKELPSQIEKEDSNLNADFRKRIAFAAELAPARMNRFDCRLEVVPARPKPMQQTVDGRIRFDNGTMQVEIDAATGWLTRYAVGGVDYLLPGAFRLRVMKDNEDPWGMLVSQYREEDGEFSLLSPEEGSRFSGLRPENVIESVRVIEDGPVRLVVEAVFGFRNSFAVQTYKLPKHGTELEIQVRVFWNEKNRMLKWSVPTRLSGSRCLGQVACGIESLPVTGAELVSQQWLMVADDERRLALSVANDGLYGSDCKDGELRLSLVRSPAYCGHPIGERAIVPQDRFLPRIDQGERLYTFRVNASGLADRLDAIGREALVLNQKPMPLSFFPSGHGEPPQPGAQVDDPCVQLQAFKQAEDGTGWIVRLFNASASARTTRLSIPPLGVKTRVRLGPFELKTLLIGGKGGGAVDADLIERPLTGVKKSGKHGVSRIAGAVLAGLMLVTANGAPGAEKAAPADFYVAVSGKDGNPGTAKAPFATLAKAREAVRGQIKEGLAKDLVVEIRGGTYPVTETLTFGPEDSGTEKFSITYAASPGEKVVLSGGRKITGWKKGTNEVWTVEIPEAKEGKLALRSPEQGRGGEGGLYPRQLFVNGQRAIRARTPNADDKTPWWKIKTAQAVNPGAPQNSQLITVSVDHPIQAWKNAADVELIYLKHNDASRKRVGAVNEAAQTFTLPPPHQWPPSISAQIGSHPAPGIACYLENAPEMLDQPGEWYLDRTTGVLTYWPRPGENVNEAEVIAPVVQNTLLAVTGVVEKPVRNLHFKGIHVEHVDWPLPPYGFALMFGCLQVTTEQPKFYWIDAAVSFKHARACNFTDGGVAHAGGIGIGLLSGCAQNVIEGNHIYDLGGGGIVAGGIHPRDGLWKWAEPIAPDDHKGYRIANNYIHHCGTDYFGAIGIFLALTQEAVVAHNLIHDIAYNGIVISGNCTPLKLSRNNTVEYNHIHDVLQTAVDGGGIYLSFPHEGWGAVIRGNFVHDIRHNGVAGGFGSNGFFLDGVTPALGVKNYQFVSNVICNVQDGAVRMFNCRQTDNKWIDNTFSDGSVSRELVDAMQARAGLEPAYRQLSVKTPSALDVKAAVNEGMETSGGAGTTKP